MRRRRTRRRRNSATAGLLMLRLIDHWVLAGPVMVEPESVSVRSVRNAIMQLAGERSVARGVARAGERDADGARSGHPPVLPRLFAYAGCLEKRGGVDARRRRLRNDRATGGRGFRRGLADRLVSAAGVLPAQHGLAERSRVLVRDCRKDREAEEGDGSGAAVADRRGDRRNDARQPAEGGGVARPHRSRERAPALRSRTCTLTTRTIDGRISTRCSRRSGAPGL